MGVSHDPDPRSIQHGPHSIEAALPAMPWQDMTSTAQDINYVDCYTSQATKNVSLDLMWYSIDTIKKHKVPSEIWAFPILYTIWRKYYLMQTRSNSFVDRATLLVCTGALCEPLALPAMTKSLLDSRDGNGRSTSVLFIWGQFASKEYTWGLHYCPIWGTMTGGLLESYLGTTCFPPQCHIRTF